MRRIVAIILSQLACEIARSKRTQAGSRAPGPIGVILEPDGGGPAVLETALLDAVEDEARRYGVRPGQRVTEASALLASLSVHRVSYGELDTALGRVAEVALSFGPTAAIQLRPSPGGAPRAAWGDAPFDTVWLDVTGSAHLAGGEEALLAELEERLGALGHRARLSIAGGPRLAQAMARWAPGILGTPGARSSGRYPIAPPRSGEGAQAMALLPVQALPIDPDTVGFLLRLGVLTVGDLARLPRASAAARLGDRAAEVLDLAAGRDDLPLLPYAPPREIVEEASFEEGVENTEALLFVLRGMTSRASVRLGARGEACTRIEVELPLDRSIARLRLAERVQAEGAPETEAPAAGPTAPRPATVGSAPPAFGGSAPDDRAIGFHVDLPAPLASEADLLRALKARLERTELFAPAVGLRLRIAQIVPAREVQLDLSRDRGTDPDSLPALLAELSAEIGADRVGLLAVEDAHRPEARSRLVPVAPEAAPKGRGKRAKEQLSFPGAWSRQANDDAIPTPARLLPAPISLGRVVNGAVVSIGGERQLFAIEKMRFLMRLDGVEWWSRSPASRDYARAWLGSGEDGDRLLKPRGAKRGKGASGEALLYVVRKTGEVFLQGWYE
jgi:protein ImuB